MKAAAIEMIEINEDVKPSRGSKKEKAASSRGGASSRAASGGDDGDDDDIEEIDDILLTSSTRGAAKAVEGKKGKKLNALRARAKAQGASWCATEDDVDITDAAAESNCTRSSLLAHLNALANAAEMERADDILADCLAVVDPKASSRKRGRPSSAAAFDEDDSPPARDEHEEELRPAMKEARERAAKIAAQRAQMAKLEAAAMRGEGVYAVDDEDNQGAGGWRGASSAAAGASEEDDELSAPVLFEVQHGEVKIMMKGKMVRTSARSLPAMRQPIIVYPARPALSTPQSIHKRSSPIHLAPPFLPSNSIHKLLAEQYAGAFP